MYLQIAGIEYDPYSINVDFWYMLSEQP